MQFLPDEKSVGLGDKIKEITNKNFDKMFKVLIIFYSVHTSYKLLTTY